MENNLTRHQMRNNCKKVLCPICNIEIPFLENNSHKLTHNPIENQPHSSSHSHLISPHQLTVPSFQFDDNYSDLYSRFKKYIESNIKTGSVTTTVNFQILDLSNETIAEFARQIMSSQVNAFKINASIGYILRNNETQELVYYWASRNNQLLFEKPFLINCQRDMDNFIESIVHIDLKAHVVYPNTKFSFIKSTNITFYLTHLHGVPIGAGRVLPSYLMRNKGLYTLVKATNNKPYQDKLCLFRCIALHTGAKIRAIETPARRLFEQYCDNTGIDCRNFAGVTLADLEQASAIFGIGINVYEQCAERLSKLVFRSVKQENIMYVNLYDDHFSYIKDLQKYSSSYTCTKCKKIFSRHWNLKQHFGTCDATTRQIYHSGIYRVSDSIFDTLETHNIFIPTELQYFEYRICFDIECLMNRDTDIPNTDKVTYSFKHELASISVCSNVPEYMDPKCFVSDGCPKKLVKNMLTYMYEIAEEVSTLQREKFAEFIPQIDVLDDTKIQDRFDEYMDQVPVLSFNGSRYDLKIIKEQLVSNLRELDEVRYVIKRGSSYSCIATEHFKFLDITYYLAAGVSYDGFLKAYNANITKGYFPYEYFDSLDKLNSTELPSYEHFYSFLKGKNTLEPCVSDTLSTAEIALIGREPIRDNPLTETETQEIGHMRYSDLSQQWDVNEWSFRDFLVHYNNRCVACSFVCHLSCVGRMSAVCLSYVCRMSVVCLSYVCCMSVVCLSYVCSMSAVCLSYFCRMSVVFLSYVCRMSVVCLSVVCMS